MAKVIPALQRWQFVLRNRTADEQIRAGSVTKTPENVADTEETMLVGQLLEDYNDTLYTRTYRDLCNIVYDVYA